MENATEDYRDIFYFEALYIRGKNIENIDVLLELPELKVLFYEAENEEQEEILQELSDRAFWRGICLFLFCFLSLVRPLSVPPIAAASGRFPTMGSGDNLS